MQAIQTGKQPVADVLKALAAKLDSGLLQGTYPDLGHVSGRRRPRSPVA